MDKTLSLDIIDFINRRFTNDSNWCSGNCYWFAVILKTRFPDLKIYYLPVTNHFVVGDGKIFYDWHGEHYYDQYTEPIYEWDEYQNIDLFDYNSVKKYCIL